MRNPKRPQPRKAAAGGRFGKLGEGPWQPGQADAGVQAACLATLASLLAVPMCDEDFTFLGASVGRRGASVDALDAEVSRLTALFVKRPHSDGGKAFARGLAEASHFKLWMERLARPRAMWPRGLRLFGAWAERAYAERLC